MPSQKKGKLYLIPTVIANNTTDQAITTGVKDVCRKTTYYLVENIRTARRFISSLNLDIEIPTLHFEELSKKTPDVAIAKLMQVVLDGKDVGVISEAGCPGIADPGARAVAWAHQNEIEVVPLVGPSSILLALIASGFSGQSFTFHGYLPIDKKERADSLKHLEKEALHKNQTQIFMETPYRNNKLLDDIVNHCSNNTMLCIASDIMGRDNLIKSAPISYWKKHKPDLHKKPTIFILSGS